MTVDRFYFFGEKWRAGTKCLNLAQKGLYIDIIEWCRTQLEVGVPCTAFERIFHDDAFDTKLILSELIELEKVHEITDDNGVSRLLPKRVAEDISCHKKAKENIDLKGHRLARVKPRTKATHRSSPKPTHNSKPSTEAKALVEALKGETTKAIASANGEAGSLLAAPPPEGLRDGSPAQATNGLTHTTNWQPGQPTYKYSNRADCPTAGYCNVCGHEFKFIEKHVSAKHPDCIH